MYRFVSRQLSRSRPINTVSSRFRNNIVRMSSTGSNNNQQPNPSSTSTSTTGSGQEPGLISGHAQFAKGAVVVRLPLSFRLFLFFSSVSCLDIQ